jgi:hypothetical protein
MTYQAMGLAVLLTLAGTGAYADNAPVASDGFTAIP